MPPDSNESGAQVLCILSIEKASEGSALPKTLLRSRLPSDASLCEAALRYAVARDKDDLLASHARHPGICKNIVQTCTVLQRFIYEGLLALLQHGVHISLSTKNNSKGL